MSEEEIIKRLKNIIEINKSFLDCNIKENSNIYKDIQRLLDLYKQAKEKNKEYQELLKHNEFKRKIETCMTHNMPENIEIVCMIREDFERNFGNDYISKDKIKELLKEIQKEKDKATKHILEKDYQLAENGAIAQELGWVEGKIQSLLEEN